MIGSYDKENEEISLDVGNGVTQKIKVSHASHEEFYNQDGKLHREDGPAVIDYRKRSWSYYYSYRRQNEDERLVRGNLPRIEWYINGKLHREDGPAVTIFQSEIGGLKEREEWYIDDRLEHPSGDAVVLEYDCEGELCRQSWLDDCLRLHRDDGHACISRGVKKWYKHGILHRSDGPAVEGDNILSWYKKGALHRLDGPATMKWSDNYNRVEFKWYKNGLEHRSKNKPSYIKFGGIDRKYWDEIQIADDVLRLGGTVYTVTYRKDGRLYRKDFENPVHINGEDIGTEKERIVDAKWLRDGTKHREDGPAVIYGKKREWYFDGKRHCVCGPAVSDHHPCLNEWWIRGKRLQMKKVRPWLRSNKIDLSTEAGQLALYMAWAEFQ